MKQSLGTLLGALLIVAGLTGWSLWERHQGALAVEARVRAESLIVAAQAEQRQIALKDSVRSRAVSDSLQTIRAQLRASQERREASQAKADSLAALVGADSVVPRDTVQALIGAFQAERAASQQVIAGLQADTALLERTLAGKDSTIAALNHSLDGERQQLATALKPQSPSLLSRGLDLGLKILAVRGALAFALGK